MCVRRWLGVSSRRLRARRRCEATREARRDSRSSSLSRMPRWDSYMSGNEEEGPADVMVLWKFDLLVEGWGLGSLYIVA
jgi:hypothetical protein